MLKRYYGQLHNVNYSGSRTEHIRFCKKRITEIINETDAALQYINTKHDPADKPTRGMSTKKLKNNKLRWYGPEWLLS